MLKWELYRCEVYVLRWELPRNRGLNLTPQAQGQRVSLSLLLTCFLTLKKKSARINDPISTEEADNKHC